MTFAAVPGDRVQYQVDGTVLMYGRPGLTQTECSQPQKEALNGWASANRIEVTPGKGVRWGLTAVFPQARDLKGVFWGDFKAGGTSHESMIGTHTVETSIDTTTGSDGAWSTQATWTPGSYEQAPGTQGSYWGHGRIAYRDWIRPVSVLGVKGVRITAIVASIVSNPGDAGVGMFHLYADIPSAAGGDRIQAWHPTLDQPLRTSDMELGDRRRGEAITKTFRFKNTSSTYTAMGLKVGKQVGTNSGGNVYADYMKVSADGSNWVDEFVYGNLAAGATTPVLSVRFSLPLNADFGPFDPYIRALPTDWT